MIPLPYLPTPVRVLEIDLAAPIAPIPGCAGYAAARILVRLRGEPLGWVTIEEPGEVIPAERVREALAGQLAGPIHNAALSAGFAAEAGAGARSLPPISVVVCTRDRPDSMAHCLLALLALDYPAFEIVVVDNAPMSDATMRLVASHPVRYVREDRPGLDWARNRGIAESRHGIIAFTDDDVRVDAGWLRAIATAFGAPEVMLVTGLICPAELETEAQIVFEYQYGGMGKGCREWWSRRDLLTPAQLIGTHHLGAGANMACRREIFERAGRFDTALDVGTPSHGGGDLDMFYRVLAAGGTARYEPRAIVWHAHRRELPALRRQLRDNGRAFGVYLLTRFFERRTADAALTRLAVVRYTVFVWLQWLAGRVVRRFRRRETLPLPMQSQELAGVLEAPFAYFATRRSDARLRQLSATPEAPGG